ncbi:MAG: response regulator [Limnobacter sp.]|nr:response regulator [Limnobacter sp.]
MSSLARSAVIIYDCNLRVTQLNAAARRLAGAGDWVGRPLHQCLASLGRTSEPPLDRVALLEHARRGSAFPVRVGETIWRAELGSLSDSDPMACAETASAVAAADRGSSLASNPSPLPCANARSPGAGSPTPDSESLVLDLPAAGHGVPVGALVLREAGRAEDYRDLALDRVDFLAALSHDLRTPLNAMLGWLHLLSMPKRGPELAARAIAGLRQAIEQQQQLLIDWADKARADHPEASQGAGDMPAGVSGAPAHPSGAREHSEEANGEPFVDADASSAGQARDRRGRKSVRINRLVQQHRSNPALGRRPRQASLEGVPALVDDAGSGLSGVYVLAVDDRPEMLDVLTQVLAADGASIETTTSADDALARYPDWAASGGERLLVSDLAMPGRDGFSLIREIRALERHRRMPRLPAVALSAHGLPDVRRRAIENGYDLFVDKPVDPRVLLGRLHKLLDR